MTQGRIFSGTYTDTNTTRLRIAQGWTAVMPTRDFHVFGRTINFNPCPFNRKEHTIIVSRIPSHGACWAGPLQRTLDTLADTTHSLRRPS